MNKPYMLIEAAADDDGNITVSTSQHETQKDAKTAALDAICKIFKDAGRELTKDEYDAQVAEDEDAANVCEFNGHYYDFAEDDLDFYMTEKTNELSFDNEEFGSGNSFLHKEWKIVKVDEK